jgi:calcineurin-like phosphoesterase family protein
MSVVRYISDLHLGHKNMAQHRGFQDEFYHDEFIIDNWNSTVKKKDVTYILGDITMEKANYEVLNRLNGLKKVIQGNHDLPQHTKRLLEYVNWVGAYYVQGHFIFSHIPIHPMELAGRFKYNIHGHIHSNEVDDLRYINVSAEAIGYKPKTLEELMNKIKEQ